MRYSVTFHDVNPQDAKCVFYSPQNENASALLFLILDYQLGVITKLSMPASGPDSPLTPSWLQLSEGCLVGKPSLSYHLAYLVVGNAQRKQIWAWMRPRLLVLGWMCLGCPLAVNVGGHLICIIAFASTLAPSSYEQKYNVDGELFLRRKVIP